MIRYCTAANLPATVSASEAGDTIVVTDSGTSAAITVTAANLTIVAADGQSPLISTATSAAVQIQATGLVLRGLRLSTTVVNGSIVAPSSAGYSATLEDCAITATGGGIHYTTGSWTGGCTLRRCVFVGRGLFRCGTSATGIVLEDCSATCSGWATTSAALEGNGFGVVLRRTRLQAPRLIDGLNAFSPVASFEAECCLFTQPSANAQPWALLRGASSVALRRCTQVLPGDGWRLEGTSALTATACGLLGSGTAITLAGSASAALVRCGRYGPAIAEGVVETAPVLESPGVTAPDYAPSYGSPWVDAGGPVPGLVTSTDLLGQAIPAGNGHDIGACEWVPAMPSVESFLSGWVVAVGGQPLRISLFRGADPARSDLLRRVALSLILHRGWILDPATGSDLHLLRADPRRAAERAPLLVREALRWFEAGGHGTIESVTATRDGDTLRIALRLAVAGDILSLEGVL